MKAAFIVTFLVGLSALYMLTAIGALRKGCAWVPFVGGIDARLRVARATNPATYWCLVAAQFAIAAGAAVVLVRFVGRV